MTAAGTFFPIPLRLLFRPSQLCETFRMSYYGSFAVGTMASADFLDAGECQAKISPGKANVLRLIAAESTILVFTCVLGRRYDVLPHPTAIASYSVPVRRYQPRSLAYFSASLTRYHLATCFTSERHLRVIGTCTLGTCSFNELLIHLPFRAHTSHIFNSGRYRSL